MSSIASPDDTDHAASSGVEKLDKIVAEKPLDCVKFCTADFAVPRNVAGDHDHLLADWRTNLLWNMGLGRFHALNMADRQTEADGATSRKCRQAMHNVLKLITSTLWRRLC